MPEIADIALVMERVRKLISKIVNVPENLVNIRRVEFNNDSLLFHVSVDGRTFKAEVSPTGEVKYIEEIVTEDSTRFCIDKRSAIVIVSRRFPTCSIRNVQCRPDGYLIELEDTYRHRKFSVFVSCDGSVKKISQRDIMLSIDFVKEFIGRKLLQRIQQLRH